MQLKNDGPEILHMAQAPLRFAEQCIKHGSDTEGGRYVRYLVHHDLRTVLSMVAGYRKAERPLKLFMGMLETKGIRQPPAKVMDDIYAPDPIDTYNKTIIDTVTQILIQPPDEEYRSQGLAILQRIKAFTDEHWCLPNEDQRQILHVIAALHLAYMPEAGRA